MNGTVKWFVIGFTVTLLIVGGIMVVRPLIGTAQGGNPNQQGSFTTAAGTGLTDDPQGRTRIPLANSNVSVSNGTGTDGVMSPINRTDNPNGSAPQPPPAGVPGPNSRPSAATGFSTEGLRTDKNGVNVPGSPLVIPSADFRSDGFDPPSMFFSFWGGYMRGGNINTCVMAPAYLPAGATLYDIYASVVDNDANASLFITLFRVDNYSGTVDVMASMFTDGAYASPDIISLEDYPIDFPVVSYPTYSYYVGACLESSATTVYSVRLWYY